MNDKQRKYFHLFVFLLIVVSLIAGMYHIFTKGVIHAYDIAIPTGSLGNLGQELEFLSFI